MPNAIRFRGAWAIYLPMRMSKDNEMSTLDWKRVGPGAEIAQAGEQRLFVGSQRLFALADEETELSGPILVYWCVLANEAGAWVIAHFTAPFRHGFEQCKYEVEEWWREHYRQKVQP